MPVARGRVALVTGSSRGLGTVIAQRIVVDGGRSLGSSQLPRLARPA